MTEKYKLRFTMRWMKTAHKEIRAIREIVWERKEDALACKALIERAKMPKFFDVEFLVFTEETPL